MTASSEKTNRQTEPSCRRGKVVQGPYYDVLMQPGLMMVRVYQPRERWCSAA